MVHKPLLMVAPNGARKTKKDHPALPVQLDEIVKTAAACHLAGADAAHLHVRDSRGEHTLDAGLYRELLREMSVCTQAMAVQITTESGGRYSPTEQRQLLYDLRPPWASVALSEMLADDDIKSARRLYQWAKAENIQIQHILYGSQEIEQLASLIKKGDIPEGDLSILFVLGRYALPKNGTPLMLDSFLLARQNFLPDASFMVCAFGEHETDCLLAAAAASGDCRVGFENNVYHRGGEIAKDNAARVSEVFIALQKVEDN